MKEEFNLEEYLNNGIETILKGIVKASFKNPKESAFIIKYALASREAQKKREQLHSEGQNIPAFLIASITSHCNLFCKGCYARANKSCSEEFHKDQLSSERWFNLFQEAKECGISFILLAGGEPFLRKEVIEKAAKVKEIMFPIFTNGTMVGEDYITLFDKNRNLVPILSIEGDKDQTDNRRGEGTYAAIMHTMDTFMKYGILYGASITLTTENIHTVTHRDFFHQLYKKGCRALFLIEYVPVMDGTNHLAPTDTEREILESELMNLREAYQDVIFLSFPGDEKYSGGCLAAGRGFFHISVDGSVEPCPFSPYSDTNINDLTLMEALKSPFFKKLHETGMLIGEHDGGCLLFQKEKEVTQLIGS